MWQIKRHDVIAVLCSDIHLCIKQPIARSEEPNWFKAMQRVIEQLAEFANKHQSPILCAGDIFDKWKSYPELINWALDHMPHMFAIPGNHDLPNHRPELEHKSAYGTLVRAGRITELGSWPIAIGWPDTRADMMLYGQHFGEDTPVKVKGKDAVPGALHVLLTHEYLWTKNTGHHGASQDSRLSNATHRFKDFDVVVVGDNHIPFDRKLKGGTHIINCGALIRRKSNEAQYRPRVGLILRNGTVSSCDLDVTQEQMTELVDDELDECDALDDESIANFVGELSRAEFKTLDFRGTVVKTIKTQNVRDEVRDVLLEAME